MFYSFFSSTPHRQQPPRASNHQRWGTTSLPPELQSVHTSWKKLWFWVWMLKRICLLFSMLMQQEEYVIISLNVKLQTQLFPYLLAYNCIKVLCIWTWTGVCACNRRDKAGKHPLRRVRPHRGLVTRWAAGSPLSLDSWGLLSTEKEDFHLHRTPAALMSRSWFKIENYFNINSVVIFFFLWRDFKDSKGCLRNVRTGYESLWAQEADETRQTSLMGVSGVKNHRTRYY